MRTKHYENRVKGLGKLKTYLSDIAIVMLATRLDKSPVNICPMAFQEIDDQGDLWFVTHKNSDHFEDIQNDNRVQLIASNTDKGTYLSIYGNATHVYSKDKLNEFWGPFLKRWFQDKDDPNLALLNVNVETVKYWDIKNDITETIVEVSNGQFSGHVMNLGETGLINLQYHIE
ncbi:pyridoxamine 5'-phosphate oxidase family protein [uncultured Winogradskyella sp.]|uniref:pyridoxamine 5'-phosphate oxidase family protein n=1 Tax=uncultured Winogradskyella sp. TaxID=395353 RepID=UPI0035170061